MHRINSTFLLLLFLSLAFFNEAVHGLDSKVLSNSSSANNLPFTVSLNPFGPSCAGGNNGSITASTNGGTPPFTFSWSPSGGSSSTASGLSAGTYSVLVTDATGFSVTETILLTEPAPLLAVIQNYNNVACNGLNTGSATVSVSGGSPGYLYSWSPNGGSGAIARNLIAGNYTVSVTDLGGCSASANVTISQPAPLSILFNNTPASCTGSANGTSAVNVSGGVAPYSYSWSPSGGNFSLASNLSAGLYTMTVTDDNGCTYSETTNITPVSSIYITYNSTDASCGMSDGALSVTPAGGQAPYSYQWSPIGGTSSVASNLPAGSYSITITDGNGCSMTSHLGVSNSSGPTVNMSASTSIACYGMNTGSATVSVSGGTLPYSYSWSPSGGNGPTASNLAGGIYTVTVTDGSGCATSLSINIAESNPLSATISTFRDIACGSSNTGSATVLASGGNPAYRYSWSPSGGTGAIANGLTTGTYTVTVTDMYGCFAQASVTIGSNSSVNATVNTIPVSCNGRADGSAIVIPTSGTAPYTYIWTPGGSTSSSLSGLSSGAYNVSIRDANGCLGQATAIIVEPPPANISLTPAHITCSGYMNGSITSSISGGLAPYSYSWQPSVGSSSSVGNLGPGNYTLIVTDNNGCTFSSGTSIVEPSPIVVSLLSSSDPLCAGGNDGTISVSSIGGTGAFSYSWNGNPGTAVLTGLSAGMHALTVTDANGCSASSNYFLTDPPPIQISSSNVQSASCSGQNDGSISVNATGGTGVLNYNWQPSGSGSILQNLSAGNYILTVSDANSCQLQQSFTVNGSGAMLANVASISDVSCNGGNDGSAGVTASGGTAPYTYNWSPSGGTLSTASLLTAGNYTVSITDLNGCQAQVTLSIGQPASLQITPSSIPASCNGGTDGSAGVTVNGGTPPYQYLWNPSGASTASINNLPAGLYTVTVTDANACTQTSSINVNAGSGMQLNTVSTNITCPGGIDGSAQVSIAGGTAPYNYSWSAGNPSGNSVTGLGTGSYTVVVTDANNCTSISQFNIVEPSPWNISINGPSVMCQGQTGTILSTVSGGTQPYTYLWDDGQVSMNAIIQPIAHTGYSFTVTDAYGCTAMSQYHYVLVRDSLSVSLSGNNISCTGSGTNLHVSVSGGDGDYTYSWMHSTTDSASVFVSPTSGTNYQVTVSDGCGTTPVSAQIYIQVETIPAVNFTSDARPECAPVNVRFTNLSPVSPEITYTWNFGDGSQEQSSIHASHVYHTPGVFSVRLRAVSQAGCINEITMPGHVIVHAAPEALFSLSENHLTRSNATLTLFNQSIGGSSYEWDLGDGTTVSNVFNPVHTYQNTGTFDIRLIVKNSAGCSDTVFGKITVREDFSVFIPNAFSPNGDGINDHFNIAGIGISKGEIRIFDRWGNEIFHSDDLHNGWNGTHQKSGELCQESVYTYRVKLADEAGEEHLYTGKISLLN
ncbi:MAG: PKD domain-containing protein [Bacteroidetes bacterium]|nr:MAG: PKD domain-containing protein [Bacteroidota bacterium]REK06634.1 MAG: PKD domain-containing protein [Bacteroidota bacterium]REK33400.1 MAG: PKD domain-containing protein [Bacteroidota bacterium]REK49799.1 MAG: PKD domain-containing protein [Bacteroidota bacterium]